MEGCELHEIHYLRTLGNADAIRESVKDAENVVLIGGSYIGCEVAASMTMMGKRATIVMQEQRTLERGFGKEAGRFVQELLEAHGVNGAREDELERFEGEGRVAKVMTRKGLELEAEAVVIGAGVAPDTGLAKRAGLEIGEQGGVRCSSRLESTAEGVYAAGDICEYESAMHGEHMQDRALGCGLQPGQDGGAEHARADMAHETVPYFYSVLGDWGELEYVGPAKDWDEEILRGSFEDGEFTNWYLQDGKVKAALTFGGRRTWSTRGG